MSGSTDRAPDGAVRLSDLTTLRLGGPARSFRELTAESDLVDAVAAADRAGEPVLVLGEGSNVVVGDAGFDGLVAAVRTRGVDVVEEAGDDRVVLDVAAGEPWDDLVARAVDAGWSGVECLSGIPGLVGATPIQNVGAYGQDVSATISQVRVWDRTEQALGLLTGAECGFGYRSSRFKAEPGRFVVLAVRFTLARDPRSAPVRYADVAVELDVAPGTRVPLADARAAVLAVRRAKGMVLDPADHDTWSAGSFFTNPVLDPTAWADLCARVRARLGPAAEPPGYPDADGRTKTSAAWLIERAGFGRGYGNDLVRLSTRHTLALTNRGTASTVDLLALAAEVADGVERAFGVRLVPEPVLVGIT